MGRLLLKMLLGLVIALGVAWAAAALWIDGPQDRSLAGLADALFVTGCGAALVALRPFGRALLVVIIAIVAVVGWWISIPPRNDRDWYPDVAELPWATVDGDLLTIHNVRNFTYRTETDYTPRWETRTYDLSKLRGVDMFISFWGPTLIAHTVASWEFSDGQHLAISIETRKEVGESYSALRGFFRQYELYYVVADERDVIGVRTNHRGEQVFLYRFKTPPAVARAILLDYLEEVNALRERPAWYNALTQNCTTTIHHHLKHVAPNSPWDWRILANGYLDQMAYERGSIDTRLPFAEMRARSDITERARGTTLGPDFSDRIRVGLPQPRQ